MKLFRADGTNVKCEECSMTDFYSIYDETPTDADFISFAMECDNQNCKAEFSFEVPKGERFRLEARQQ